ncbi:MAG: phosphate/phosphite/phosphonate ABC transporter substrate-binding protein [Anaerolineae bacterium]|nr:phosphate/phosphite/phosphonate ABC transporter substrate-binding protein [Anaerolineae bacterium]NIN98687.1 phosphate/phosphite/phosphonate ABC transporter substrate-binding protein [Anaerolineae bacterium]NIQ81570.1 phosphate/phosphite/phosphonate ABC transporter substrate-binding protein [Anaerolineae bacterium]
MKRYILLIVGAVVLLAPILVSGCAPAGSPELGSPENPIIIAFVPSGEMERVTAGGEAVAELLAEETGYTIESTVATSYAAAIEAMGAGEAQVGMLATFAYLLAHEKYDVEVGLVSVRYGSPYYTGQIIVGADTGIETLADVAGRSVCWVDATSTSGYIIPRVVLGAAGVDPESDLGQEVEAGSHDLVVMSVYSGDCEVGATYVDARDVVAGDFPDVFDKVLVIAESPEIPNDGVQFAPDVPDEVRESLIAGFLAMTETEEGLEALDIAYDWGDLVEKDDSFYDGFRQTLDAAGVVLDEYVD